jgi:uncharacterized protein (DUF736 family)
MPDFEQSPVNKPQYQKSNRNPESVGACWIKQNGNGIDYLSMKIELKNGEVLNIKGFLNSEKVTGDAKPEYILYPSKGIVKERNGNK